MDCPPSPPSNLSAGQEELLGGWMGPQASDYLHNQAPASVDTANML